MSFRVRNQKLTSTFEIGLVWLDDQFNLIGSPQILDVRSTSDNKFRKEQDPRLVQIGEQIYIVYSNDIEIQEERLSIVTRRVFVSKVKFDGHFFKAETSKCLLKYEGERNSRWEKNWVPFDYEGTLCLAYSLTPHRVVKPLFEKGGCETIAINIKSIPWEWGELRGGTPALKLNEKQYLAFFHSSLKISTSHSNEKVIPHYVMGAYVFNSTPPFEITHISPEPIVAKNFYKGSNYKTWRPVRVVFPGGFIFDEDNIWIAYGRQDHEIWLVKLNKKGLLDSLRTL